MNGRPSKDADRDGDGRANGDLSDRIRAAKRAQEPEPERSIAQKYNAASMAWRMTLELVVGTALGFLIGWSLDSLFGTMPLLMIIFGLLGFAAGIKTVLTTAKEGGNAAPGVRNAADETDGTGRG